MTSTALKLPDPPASDLVQWRAFSCAVGVLVVAGEYASQEQWQRAQAACDAIEGDVISFTTSERTLLSVFRTVSVLGLRPLPCRDLLNAALRIFAFCRAGREPVGSPANRVNFWKDPR